MQADVSAVLARRPSPRFMLVSDLDHTMVSGPGGAPGGLGGAQGGRRRAAL